jgi:hypothetical protein
MQSSVLLETEKSGPACRMQIWFSKAIFFQSSVESELHTKRNDQRLNSHNRVMLENWRANVDLQVIAISFPEPAILGKEREALG